MNAVSEKTFALKLPANILKELGIDNWDEQCQQFDFVDVDKKNWPEWAQAASEVMSNILYILGTTQALVLEELINTEATLRKHISEQTTIEQAPEATICPADYPTLLPGQEHVLQRKLDLWNRFQLAHGFGPTMLRLIISLGIVGGTMYGGFLSI